MGIVAEVAVEVNIIRLKEIDVHICGTCTVKMLLLNFFCHGTLSHDYLRRLLETKMDSNNKLFLSFSGTQKLVLLENSVIWKWEVLE